MCGPHQADASLRLLPLIILQLQIKGQAHGQESLIEDSKSCYPTYMHLNGKPACYKFKNNAVASLCLCVNIVQLL